MIGLFTPQSFALTGLATSALELERADAAFAGLAADFFRGEGWKADISLPDRFVHVEAPLRDDEDPHHFRKNLENVQALLKGSARLVETEGQATHLGFPFPSLLCGLLTSLYGAQTPRLVFVSRDVSRDEINGLYWENEQPVGIFTEPVPLSHYRSLVHGFVFMFHDLYHAAFVASLPLQIRRHWCALYDVVNALPDIARRLPLAENLLDCLTDNDIDVSTLKSPDFLAFIPFRAVVEQMQEAFRIDDEEKSGAMFRETETFLGSLLEALGAADGPGFVHGGFLVQELEQLLHRAATQAAIRTFLDQGIF